jgi:hypothetical protein
VPALVDDGVEARRGAEVALVELAAVIVQPEHGGEAPVALAVVVDVERPTRLPDDDEPRLVRQPRDAVVVVAEGRLGRLQARRPEEVEGATAAPDHRHRQGHSGEPASYPHVAPAILRDLPGGRNARASDEKVREIW